MVERDQNGRLKPGSILNPRGRPRKDEKDAVRAALNKAITSEDVVTCLAEAIRDREPWAITLYLAYDWGKPIEKVDITQSYDLDELTDEELAAIALRGRDRTVAPKSETA